MTVRVASSSGAVDTSKVTEWPGGSLPPHVAGYQQGFFSRYMDPTEVRAQLDRLAAEFPNLVTAVNLPHLSPGYQRKAQTVARRLGRPGRPTARSCRSRTRPAAWSPPRRPRPSS